MHTHTPVSPAIVELSVHDDNEVRADVQPPAEAARDHQQLDSARRVQLLHDLAFQIRQPLVQVGNTVGESLDQSLGGREGGREEEKEREREREREEERGRKGEEGERKKGRGRDERRKEKEE